jgi:hypothetical protein
MVSNKRVRSLGGRIKGVEGWEGGELERENQNQRDGGGGVEWGGGMYTSPSPTADNTTTYIQLSSYCCRVREQVLVNSYPT